MANYSIEIIDSSGSYTATVMSATTTKASGGTNVTFPHVDNNNGAVVKAISGATNATPIVLTCTAHGCSVGDVVTVQGVLGNTNANGTWRISASADANTITLENSAGNATYTAGSGKLVKHVPTKSIHSAIQAAVRAVLNAKASE